MRLYGDRLLLYMVLGARLGRFERLCMCHRGVLAGFVVRMLAWNRAVKLWHVNFLKTTMIMSLFPENYYAL